MSLLPVAEAQARLLALARPLAAEEAALADAAGRWAAAAVIARRDQPAADLSAMDGYALRFAELPGPWTVVAESRAGGGVGARLAAGEAARIFTGAPLPPGADAILVQEEARREGDVLHLAGAGPARPGEFVRARAADFAAGDPLIAGGARLTPARIGLVAIAGHATLPVRRRPRVILLSTGDELVAPGAPTPGLALPAANAPMLAAMMRGAPVEIRDGGILPDRLDLLTAGLAAAAGWADVIVTTGGASVGDHDLVRPALLAAGATLDFWRIAMRPGKPLMAGRLGDAIVLGLPGNPVSAFVTAHVFLLPLLRRLAGDPAPIAPARPRRLVAPLPAVGARADYVRGRMEEDGVRPLAGQDSAALAMLAQADVLIVRPAQAPTAASGESVDTLDIA